MAGRRRAEQPNTASGGPTGVLAGPSRLVGIAALLAVAAMLAGLVVPAMWRSVGTDVEASAEANSLFTLVNQARASNGLAPLDFASDLTAVAARRASIMAESRSLTHTPDLGGEVCCWTWIGENVAFAGSVQAVHEVLMNSAPHRANILNGDADDIGVAVVKSGGEYWAAQVFRARSDADRADDANTGSRSDVRGSPTTTTGAPSSTTGSTGPTTTTPVLTRAQLRSQQLRHDLQNARQDLRVDRRKHGPFDPVKAAVRYSTTLDRVTR